MQTNSLNSLSDQLEATCHLLAAARKLQLRRSQRSARIGWSLVASMIVLGMVGLWRAGETIGGQRTQLDAATSEAGILSGKLNSSVLRIAELNAELGVSDTMQAQLESELMDTQSALLKANRVIDAWMKRAYEKKVSTSSANGN